MSDPDKERSRRQNLVLLIFVLVVFGVPLELMRVCYVLQPFFERRLVN